MPLALILLLQAVAAPAAASPAWDPIDFDLARYRPDGDDGFAVSACRRGTDPSAIVVCGRRAGWVSAFPMAQMERRYGVRPLIAEIGVAGDLRANIHAEAVAMDRGAVSNRVMIGLKLPF